MTLCFRARQNQRNLYRRTRQGDLLSVDKLHQLHHELGAVRELLARVKEREELKAQTIRLRAHLFEAQLDPTAPDPFAAPPEDRKKRRARPGSTPDQLAP
ncbi:hypothetical protein PAPYR_4881 [Paratrimastix pyriformis]|uniref:Uncharacterized protein n=1 Tax=Paratrimastix pyriformis TaxID=342808 RepID=A0ABQ8ULG8_9EUKA|nr:hypothetical protein PAPYR_4881 [Paratrimastix pyriformis]